MYFLCFGYFEHVAKETSRGNATTLLVAPCAPDVQHVLQDQGFYNGGICATLKCASSEHQAKTYRDFKVPYKIWSVHSGFLLGVI